MSYRRWTAEESALAKQLRADGLSYIKIGAEIGRHPNSVASHLQIERQYSQGRTCSQCDKAIRDANESGLCQKHLLTENNRDRDFQAHRIAGLRRCPSMQAGTAKRRDAARKAAATRMANPEYRAWLTNQMRTVVIPAGHTPEAEAKRNRKEMGRKITEGRLGWCPVEYRDLYRSIVHSGYVARVARQMVMDQIAADKARAQSKLSPFERQELALQRGGRIVANDTKASLTNPANYGESRWEVGRVA